MRGIVILIFSLAVGLATASMAHAELNWSKNEHCRILCEKPLVEAGAKAMEMFIYETRTITATLEQRQKVFQTIFDNCIDNYSHASGGFFATSDRDKCIRHWFQKRPRTRDIILNGLHEYDQCYPKYCK